MQLTTKSLIIEQNQNFINKSILDNIKSNHINSAKFIKTKYFF